MEVLLSSILSRYKQNGLVIDRHGPVYTKVRQGYSSHTKEYPCRAPILFIFIFYLKKMYLPREYTNKTLPITRDPDYNKAPFFFHFFFSLAGYKIRETTLEKIVRAFICETKTSSSQKWKMIVVPMSSRRKEGDCYKINLAQVSQVSPSVLGWCEVSLTQIPYTGSWRPQPAPGPDRAGQWDTSIAPRGPRQSRATRHFHCHLTLSFWLLLQTSVRLVRCPLSVW